MYSILLWKLISLGSINKILFVFNNFLKISLLHSYETHLMYYGKYNKDDITFLETLLLIICSAYQKYIPFVS